MAAPLAPLLSGWRSAPLPDLDSVWAVAPGGRAFALAGLFESLNRTLLVILPGESDAEELVDDLKLFTSDVVFAPAWETLPFEHVSPNTATMTQRAEARHRLAVGSPTIIVASVRSAIQRLSDSDVAPLSLNAGEEIEMDGLTRDLAKAGYHRTDRVEARGEFAVRGGIVDVFPGQADQPIRLDFWGDRLDEIRQFSVATQRSLEPVERFVAYPA
ncbi:MAG: transcription-repair coupling factor, partial [Acidimicrobiia bacterium]